MSESDSNSSVKEFVADVQDDESLKDTVAVVRIDSAQKIVENEWIVEESIEAWWSDEPTVEEVQEAVREYYSGLHAKTRKESPNEVTLSKDAFHHISFELTEDVEFEFKE